jgi:antitoxin HicB
VRYPLDLRPDQNNTVIAQAIDVPEALTFGDDEAEARAHAVDALICALGGYIDDGRPIPKPSPPRGRPVAELPPMVAAKLAIHDAMRGQGVTPSALAARLGCDPRQVRRLLDLDHASTLAQLERGLAALGKRLVLEVRNAA